MACSKVVELGTEKKVTRMVTFRKNLQWKIEKFFDWRLTAGNCEESPVYEIPLGDLREPYKFFLRIHPKGILPCEGEDAGFISIYLVNESDERLSIDRKIYVEKSSGEHLEVLSEEGPMVKKTNIWGTRKAVPISLLNEHPDIYLPYGTLTLGALIVVQLPENVTVSKFTDSILEKNINSQETITDFLAKTFDTSLYENEANYARFSDFTIICGDDSSAHKFKCHKIFLSSRSPVFEAMFTHGTTECLGNEVFIRDITPETMKKLLHFVYTDSIKDNMIDVALWSASDKYQIHRLKAICERHLATKLSIENAVENGVSAHLHGSDIFENQVVRFIAQNWSAIRNTPNWDEVKKYPDLLCDILSNVVPVSIGKRNVSSEESIEGIERIAKKPTYKEE